MEKPINFIEKPIAENPVKVENIEREKNKLLVGCINSLRDAIAVLEKKEEENTKEALLCRRILALAEVANSSKDCLPEDFLFKMKFLVLAIIEMVFLDDMTEDEKNAFLKPGGSLKRKYGRDSTPTYLSSFESQQNLGSVVDIKAVFLDLPTLIDDIRALREAGGKTGMKVWAYDGSRERDDGRIQNTKLSFLVMNRDKDIEESLRQGNRQLIIFPEIIEEDDGWEKLNDAFFSVAQDLDYQAILVAGVKMNEKVGTLMISESNGLRLRSQIFSFSSLPRQEELLACLEDGISIFKEEIGKTEADVSEENSFDKKIDLNEELDGCISALVLLEKSVAQRYYRKKMETFMGNGGREEDFLKAHEEHYRRFFAVNGKEPDEILLTRSGVSANNAVILALRDSMPRESWAYYQKGWYYDNIEAIEKKFNSGSFERANILFINTDSCYPDNPDKFHREQELLVKEFFERAKKEEDRKFALVVDVTTDLLWNPNFSLDDMPKNLTLIKTFSITKHQRGSKNYFFGGMTAWNSEGLREKMEKKYDRQGGRLMTTGIINYPRLRQSEIKSNIDHLRKLAQSFSEGLNGGQSSLPDEERLKINAYNYYSYVVFPFKLKDYPYINDSEWDLGGLAESGDSFGLDRTRVVYVPKRLKDDEHAIRFSFGIKENEENSRKLGWLTGKNWERFLQKVKDIK